MAEDLRKIKSCPECGGTNIAYKESENQIICKDCGLIYEPLAEKTKK